MKNDYLDNMLQELNSISRMAVIENASATEKMVSTYSKLLKYRWQEEERQVTAAKEMDMVLKYCELFRLKHEGLLEYSYMQKSDVKAVFVPHYTAVSCIKNILTVLEMERKPVRLQIAVQEEAGMTEMLFTFTGKVDFKAILEKAILNSEHLEYESIGGAKRRWLSQFGEESVTIHKTGGEQLDIFLRCN